MEDAHALYQRLGLVVMSGAMTAKQNKDGKWKKKFAFQQDWEKLEKHAYAKSKNGYAILTGKKNNLVAIDIDDPETDANKELMDLMTDCNFVQQTKKGFHYVYAYDERLAQTTNEKLGLDTRTDGGCIFAEPTECYNDQQELVAHYTWIRRPDEDEGLVALPNEVVEYLTKLDRRYVRTAMAVEDPPTTENVSVETLATDPTTNLQSVFNKMVEALPVECLTNYADWIKIGMVFHNEGLTCADWDAVSRRATNYEAGECEKHWATFGKATKRKVSSATLWKMLKDNNPVKFYELMEQREDFWNLVLTINHLDVAKYFYNLNPDMYLWSEVMGWFSITANNTWKAYESKTPSGLCNKVAETMMDLAKDTKKAELTKYARESAGITDGDKQKEVMKKHQARMTAIQLAYKQFGSREFTNGVCSFLPTYYEKENLERYMNMNRNLFAFNDGVLEVETGVFRPIVPRDYLSFTCGYAYPCKPNPEIRKRIWTFLLSMYDGDEGVAKYVLCVLASCLSGLNRWEEFYFFTGNGGNGKGVLADLLKFVFGEYYMSVDVSLFTKPVERKDQPIPALVDAKWKRIMMTSEPEASDTLQAGLIKKVSGNDSVEARTLNSKYIHSYVPQFKLLGQANGVPKMNKVDGGVVRRMRVVKFPLDFKTEKEMQLPERKPNWRLADPDVKHTHSKTAVWRDEFMLMLIETYNEIKDWKSLPMPPAVRQETTGYLDENNPLKEWFEAYYDKAEGDAISAEDLKMTYHADTQTQGNAFNQERFKAYMKLLGFEPKKNRVNRSMYSGLVRKPNP